MSNIRQKTPLNRPINTTALFSKFDERVKIHLGNLIIVDLPEEFSSSYLRKVWFNIDEKIEELISKRYYLIFDFSNVMKDTSTEIREYMTREIKKRMSNIRHLFFVVRNPILEMSIKYVIRPTMNVPVMINKTTEEAVEEAIQLYLDL